VVPRWNLKAERVCFSSPVAFKTYVNLWDGKNQVIIIIRTGERHEAWMVASPGESMSLSGSIDL
jgi:hypothetical protein